MNKLFSHCTVCKKLCFLPIRQTGSDNQKIYLCRTCTENLLRICIGDRVQLLTSLDTIWKWLVTLYVDKSVQWINPKVMKA